MVSLKKKWVSSLTLISSFFCSWKFSLFLILDPQIRNKSSITVYVVLISGNKSCRVWNESFTYRQRSFFTVHPPFVGSVVMTVQASLYGTYKLPWTCRMLLLSSSIWQDTIRHGSLSGTVPPNVEPCRKFFWFFFPLSNKVLLPPIIKKISRVRKMLRNLLSGLATVRTFAMRKRARQQFMHIRCDVISVRMSWCKDRMQCTLMLF